MWRSALWSASYMKLCVCVCIWKMNDDSSFVCKLNATFLIMKIVREQRVVHEMCFSSAFGRHLKRDYTERKKESKSESETEKKNKLVHTRWFIKVAKILCTHAHIHSLFQLVIPRSFSPIHTLLLLFFLLHFESAYLYNFTASRYLIWFFFALFCLRSENWNGIQSFSKANYLAFKTSKTKYVCCTCMF